MSHLGLLPIALVVLSVTAFVVSYCIAVANGDVRPAFPYISDTGSKRPESCIFGQFLNTASFLSFCTMFVRYKAVQAITHRHGEDKWLRRMNVAAMLVGGVSAFGLSLVANFQEGTMVEKVHITGAFLCFVPGVFYTFLQTALSYHMSPSVNGLYICRVRLSICLVSMVSLAITIIAGGLSIHEWETKEHSTKSKFDWGPDDPGYDAHIVSSSGEWITALTFMFYFFTFVREFNKFELEVNTRPLVQHLDEILERDLQVEVRVTQHLEPDERTKLLA